MRYGSASIRYVLAIAGLCCATAAAGAEPAPLDSDGLKALVPGTLIELDTPLNTVIPIRFTPDGMMTGEAKELASYLGAERDRGRWHITNDKLCLKWFRWFDAEERCLILKQDAQKIHWQEPDGKSGTATIIERAEIVAAKPTPPPAPKAPPPPVMAAAAPAAAPVASPPPAAAPETKSEDGPPVALTVDAKPNAFAGITIISRAEAAVPPSTAADEPAAAETDPEPPRIPEKPRAEPAKLKKPAPSKLAAAKPVLPKPVAGAKVSSVVVTKDQMAKRALASEPTYEVSNVEDDDVLNIRNGPSEYHAAVGAIPPSGRGVKIVGTCKSEWCPITHGATRGWVNRYYLSQETPVAGSTSRVR